MEIRKLNTDHAAQVHRILSASFSNPWSLETVGTLLRSDKATCFGAFDGDLMTGYAALEWVLDEGSLTDIAVLPEYRGRGIARLLMNVLIDEAQERRLQFVLLEVRESNTAAINLYRSFGFEQVGRRKKYYSDPCEDGLLMTKNI